MPVSVLFLMFTCMQNIYAQSNASAGTKDDVSATNTNTVTENTVITTTDETKLPITTPSGGTNVSGSHSTVNGIWVFLRMILVLAIVLGLIWFVFKMMKKSSLPGGGEDNPFMRKVSSVTLGPGKSVQIITLIDKAYMVGVSDDSVNLISEIKDKELIEAMNLYADKNSKTKKPRSFADVLDIFMPNGPHGKKEQTKKGSVYDGSAEQIMDMLKKQRDRLNKEDKE